MQEMPQADTGQGSSSEAVEVIAFAGHRPDKLGGWNPAHPVVARVRKAIRLALVRLRPRMVISGMALGVDQWAATECVALELPFTAALPCDDMDMAWPTRSRAGFRTLLASAAAVHVVSPGSYKPWKMQRRNEWMVDHCGLLVTVHDGSPGGTWNCIQYARSVSRAILPLSWRE